MWFKHKKVDDTQPMHVILPSAIQAYEALNQVAKNKQAAEQRAAHVQERADELVERCNDNHFAQAWLSILRQGAKWS